MIDVLHRKQDNWLIYLGGVLLPLTLVGMMIMYDGEQPINSRELLKIRFELFVLESIFLAPIIEEFIFRGIFTNNRFIKVISVLSTPLFVLFIVGNTISYYLLPLYLIACLLYFFKNKKPITNTLYFLNALLFSIAHYKIEDFSNFSTSIPILIQFSIGLISIWVVVNFSLFRAIFFHFLWNFIFVGLLFVSIQFANTEVFRYQSESYAISIKEVPRYPSRNSTLSYTSDGLHIEYMEIRKIHELIQGSSTKEKVVSIIPYLKYNIEVVYFENLSQEEMNTILIEFLIDNGYIKKYP